MADKRMTMEEFRRKFKQIKELNREYLQDSLEELSVEDGEIKKMISDLAEIDDITLYNKKYDEIQKKYCIGSYEDLDPNREIYPQTEEGDRKELIRQKQKYINIIRPILEGMIVDEDEIEKETAEVKNIDHFPTFLEKMRNTDKKYGIGKGNWPSTPREKFEDFRIYSFRKCKRNLKDIDIASEEVEKYQERIMIAENYFSVVKIIVEVQEKYFIEEKSIEYNETVYRPKDYETKYSIEGDDHRYFVKSFPYMKLSDAVTDIEDNNKLFEDIVIWMKMNTWLKDEPLHFAEKDEKSLRKLKELGVSEKIIEFHGKYIPAAYPAIGESAYLLGTRQILEMNDWHKRIDWQKKLKECYSERKYLYEYDAKDILRAIMLSKGYLLLLEAEAFAHPGSPYYLDLNKKGWQDQKIICVNEPKTFENLREMKDWEKLVEDLTGIVKVIAAENYFEFLININQPKNVSWEDQID